MKDYEKNFGFKTIWQSFIRRWKVIIAIFLPISIATIITTQFIIKKTYTSDVILLNSTNLDATRYSTIKYCIEKDETINKTVDNLASLPTPIVVSSETIKNGLSFVAFSSASPGSVSFSFSSEKRSIVKPIIVELTNTALLAIKDSGFNMVITKQPSEPLLTSKNNSYLIIGIASGIIVAIGFALIDEIISDEVYDKSDVELLGSPSFEITASK